MKTILSILITAIVATANISNIEAKSYKTIETNDQGQPITITVSTKEDSSFSPLKQYKFKYYNDGMISEKAQYYWDTKDGKWKETEKYVYEYNTNKQLVSLGHTHWDKTKKSWSNKVQYMLYVYDDNREVVGINYLNTEKIDSLQTITDELALN